MDYSKLDKRFIQHVNVPSNLGTIEPPLGRAVGVGQCGDSVEVTLKVIDERIADIAPSLPTDDTSIEEKPSDATI
jgi:NifU-like protein involved in Fe-S cluster formation